MRNLSTGIRGGTWNTIPAVFLEGTNATTIKSTVATNYAVDGLGYTKAITDNIAMTALAIQADLTTCLYLIQVNASGTILLTKGVEVLSTALAAGTAVLEMPELTADYCPLALMRIVLSGGTFTSGTTDLSGAGVTATFTDLFTIPPQPMTS